MDTIPINNKKLKELNRLCRHHDINPLFLNHHLDNKSKNPVDKLAIELQKEVIEFLTISDKNEIDELVTHFPRHLQSIATRSLGETYDLEVLSFCYLIFELLKYKFPLKEIINTNNDKSEILKIYPELQDLLDDDNLLEIDERFKWTYDGLIYKKHVLFFHQFLRRGYFGKLNTDFLAKLEKYYRESKNENKFRVALDHTRIVTEEFYQTSFELDTWYGCTFDEKEIDNPSNLGLTVIKRNKYYPFDLNNTFDRTEFLWTLKNNIKTVQIEEISNFSNKYDYLYLNKYVHSERDIERKKLIHFDGAVKAYLNQNYEKRFNTDLKGDSKSHRKIKLFRIDGNVELKWWIDLITNFYKRNEMIIEYFDPNQYNLQFGNDIEVFKRHEENKSR